jgi:Tol biopolymer transport system component
MTSPLPARPRHHVTLAATLALSTGCIPPGAWPGSHAAGSPAAAPGGSGPAASAPAAGPQGRMATPLSPDLVTTDAARGLVRLTKATSHEGQPMLSPDGKRLLATSWVPEVDAQGQLTGAAVEKVIITLRPGGGAATALTSRRTFADSPTWLGDKTFAFVATTPAGRVLMRAARAQAGAASTRVLDAEAVPELGSLSASADGSLIALQARLGDGASIAVVEPGGNGLTALGEGILPRLSPDGRRVAFTRQVGSYWQVFTIGVEGDELTQVTDGESTCDFPSWSPDGAWLVMTCNTGWQRFGDVDAGAIDNVFLVRPDGTELTQLTDGARRVTEPSWGVDGWIYLASDAAGSFDLYRLRPRLER